MPVFACSSTSSAARTRSRQDSIARTASALADESVALGSVEGDGVPEGDGVVVAGGLGSALAGGVLPAGVGVDPIAVSDPGQNRSAATAPPASSATTMRPTKIRERRGFARRARAMVTTPELV
jgi:hypothetical protein